MIGLRYYRRWGVKKKDGQGKKPVIPLRFSKSGNPEIEKAYATHFVDLKKTAEIKEQCLKKPNDTVLEVVESLQKI